MKKFISLFLVCCLCVALIACGEVSNQPTDPSVLPTVQESTTTIEEAAGELVILFTNDVHNAYQRDDDQGRMGYAALAAYRNQLISSGDTVVLIDGGDAIQGEAVGTLSKGAYLVDIMNEMAYDFAVPGNHEFDFGMEQFLNLALEHAQYTYLSCNFKDLESDELVFEPYQLVEYNGVTVAYVGICTPETISKSTPAYFQDADGNYIYGFADGEDGQELYDCVQKSIDDARNEGADYVICIGHVGIDPASSPWTSVEIIANTTGISLFLDGHSHSILDGAVLEDMDGNEVVLCSTGTKLERFAEIRLNLDTGDVNSRLVTGLTGEDEDILSFTDGIASQFEVLLSEVVGTSETDLVIYDPEEPDTRLIRSRQTNLGNFCADAYQAVSGADIAFVNGGGIREEIAAGDVTYGDLIAVHPFGNTLCVVEVTGQEILDALELAYRHVGEGEDGGFQHVSGLTLTIDTSIPSSVVVNDNDEFVEVSGQRRVSNVLVGDEPIDPEKVYTVASHNYMLKLGGGGFTMFLDNVLVQDEVMIDNQVLILYLQEHLDGVIPVELYGEPMGQDRIQIIDGTEE